MYTQTISFDQNKAGKLAGYCLANVRKGFGIGVKYPTAIAAWNGTEQHADYGVPANVDVPLFYTYKTEGHVNVHLADGRIWSDGTIYKSLESYLNAKPAVKYLGWGESINEVPVLAYAPDSVRIKIKPTTWNVREGAGTQYPTTGKVVHVNEEYDAEIQGNGWAKLGEKRYVASNSYDRI